MKFVERKFKQHLAEINQTLDMQFAFAYRKSTGVYSNSMPFVKCRDFLGDALSAVEDNKTKSIYGFSWNPQKQKMYKNKLLLVIKFPTVGHRHTFSKNFENFGCTSLEPCCGVSFGKVTVLDDTTILLEAPKFWKQSVAAVSLYTYCLKCFGYNLDTTKPFIEAVQETKVIVKKWDGTQKEQRTLESTYMDDIAGKLPYFISNIKKLTQNLPKVHGQSQVDADIHTVHNRSGFVACIRWGSGLVGKRFQELKT